MLRYMKIYHIQKYILFMTILFMFSAYMSSQSLPITMFVGGFTFFLSIVFFSISSAVLHFFRFIFKSLFKSIFLA